MDGTALAPVKTKEVFKNAAHQVLFQLLVICDDAVVDDNKLWRDT